MNFMIKLIFITIIFGFSIASADDCADWFKNLNLKLDSNCLSGCLTAETGMGAFFCTKRCTEFCKISNVDKNPSKKEIINYINQQCTKRGLPKQIGLAIAWIENKMVQFEDGNTVGNKNRDKKGKLISTDWGIMQINDVAWKNTYNLNKIKNDWKYNVDAGIDIAQKSYDAAKVRSEESKGPNSFNDNLAQATYSGYNAGVANISRYRTKQDERDKIFLDTYKTSPWRE